MGQFNPDSSLEVRKLEAAEQAYWPFQRIYDCEGHRRIVPMFDPASENDDRQDSSNSTVASKWDLPDFVLPISNRKDGGLLMDTSYFEKSCTKIPVSGSNINLESCGGKIFYMGIIDILQQFNTRKRLEAQCRRLEAQHQLIAQIADFCRRINKDPATSSNHIASNPNVGSWWDNPSCVHPVLYADRFRRFFDQYTKQYKTVAIEKQESAKDQSDLSKDPPAVFTLDDISDDDDEEENVETVVFFDDKCDRKKEMKVEISPNNILKPKKSKSRRNPS